MWGVRGFDDLSQDVRFAVRSLARAPGWTLAVLVIIVLGVGAAAVVFSVVQTLLIHPIDYPAASRIAIARRVDPVAEMATSPSADYVDAWRRSARSVDAIAGFARHDVQVSSDGARTVVSAVLIDTGFLAFAGAHPIVGRNFTAEEMIAGGPRSVLLGETFWRGQLRGRVDIVGSTMRIGDGLATIVGILPVTLQLPEVDVGPPDLWLPLIRSENARLSGVAVRLRPGSSRVAAETELDSIDAHADIRGPGAGGHFVTRLIRPAETLRFANILLMLSGAVALLLIVACANVAHLMLVRGAARERELAVRYALGAGRGRIVRQIVTECLVLSGAGCAIALPAALIALRLVVAGRPTNLTALSRVTMNSSVIVSAIIFALVSGVAFGLLAGRRAVRSGLANGLRSNSGPNRRGRRLHMAFIVSEIALSATLLVGALTLVRGITRLEGTDVGFDSRGLFALTVPFPSAAASQAARDAFEAGLLERGRAVVGVRSATLAGTAPPRVTFLPAQFQAEGRPAPQGPPTTVTADAVAPDYFTTLGLRLTAGRSFDAARPDPTEVVINEAFARQLWPAASPLGRRFRAGDGTPTGESPWLTVVGAARNAVMHGLLEDAAQPAMYLPRPSELLAGPRVTLLVRVSAGASSPVNALRRLGMEVASEGAIPKVTDVEREMGETIANPRFTTMVLCGFAVVAVILAMVGLYGVVAFTVAQRTREIGIRITLGATNATIARLVVGQGLAISGIGVFLGAVGAIGGARVLAHSVDGIPGGDVESFVVGAAVLLTVSLVACIVPTVRAAAVDPLIAIRSE